MTAQQTFEGRFEDKLNTLMPYLVKTARGDEDLIQEGAIGIWESMKEQPYAATKFHATKAKWSIISVARGVGKSLDIPKQYPRKFPITIVHYDAIPDDADADLAQAILTDPNCLALDEMVIRKLDLERFINTLTTTEERYVRFKMVDELPDRTAAAALSMSLEKLHAMKTLLRGKIEDHFTDRPLCLWDGISRFGRQTLKRASETSNRLLYGDVCALVPEQAKSILTK
jgi:DNA-directed RNA polymerase specialized sigma24 family protein